MKYDSCLLEARLIKRYKRFMADVELDDGTQMTLYCPNTGSMKNCLYPEHRIWYSDSGNSKRKYPCTWELAEIPVFFDGEERISMAGLNTGRANALVEELLLSGRVSELSGYRTIRREVRYGEENSRIDLLLQQDGRPDCYVEVKSVTLAMGDGLGLFPDAVTSRGAKHLRELTRIVADGQRSVLFFCVQHTGIYYVSAAKEIDPVYVEELQKAVEAGVEVMAWGAKISPDSIELVGQLPVVL